MVEGLVREISKLRLLSYSLYLYGFCVELLYRVYLNNNPFNLFGRQYFDSLPVVWPNKETILTLIFTFFFLRFLRQQYKILLL